MESGSIDNPVAQTQSQRGTLSETKGGILRCRANLNQEIQGAGGKGFAVKHLKSVGCKSKATQHNRMLF